MAAAGTASPAPPETASLFARIRIAGPSDAPHIHKLIYQHAAYHGLTHRVFATESALSATLANSQPFHSVAAFLLEVSPTPFPDNPAHAIARTVSLDQPIADPEASEFRSDGGEAGVVAAGFVLFYPIYGMFVGKHGFRVEGLYVRECYRKRGLGRMLLSAVVAQAVKLGYGKVELVVLDWNVNAIEFYKKMGGEVFEQARICRFALA